MEIQTEGGAHRVQQVAPCHPRAGPEPLRVSDGWPGESSCSPNTDRPVFCCSPFRSCQFKVLWACPNFESSWILAGLLARVSPGCLLWISVVKVLTSSWTGTKIGS